MRSEVDFLKEKVNYLEEKNDEISAENEKILTNLKIITVTKIVLKISSKISVRKNFF